MRCRPNEAAKKYVEFMGGADAVLTKAPAGLRSRASTAGWPRSLTHVVFADPANAAARYLQADALEQLGYQAENATWRNEYLMGANELRNGVPKAGATPASPDTVRAMTTDMLLDFMGIRLDAGKVAQRSASYDVTFTDRKERYALRLANGVLVYTAGKELPSADVTIKAPRSSVEGILFGTTTLDNEVKAGRVQIAGDRAKLETLFAALDRFEPTFDIVTP